MLVTFRSTATESITTFQDVAVELLKMMGATGNIPGALNPEDVPAALQRLEFAVARMKAAEAETPAPPAMNEDRAADEEDEEREAPIALYTRAVPLISLLKRAAAADAEVMWEANR